MLSKRMVPKFNVEGVEHFHCLPDALNHCDGDVYIIGGAGVYKEGLNVADELHITRIPLVVEGNVEFPTIDYSKFELVQRITLSEAKNLYTDVYKRI